MENRALVLPFSTRGFALSVAMPQALRLRSGTATCTELVLSLARACPLGSRKACGIARLRAQPKKSWAKLRGVVEVSRGKPLAQPLVEKYWAWEETTCLANALLGPSDGENNLVHPRSA
ncbi:MAG: hypothetical protein V7L20_32230 [Nostoc sp.]|uniref:hypothetical protein n=1 Tax=Nostoc sp. TaxID=1180 RepID=UPI002FFC8BCE